MAHMPMLGGLNLGAAGDKETQVKFRKYQTIMDSMTDKELDETDIRKLCLPSRLKRFSNGSGRSIVRTGALVSKCGEYAPYRDFEVFNSSTQG